MGLVELFRKKHHTDFFTTPSHSQKFCIFHKFLQFYKYDISETDTHNPEAALEQSEQKAAKIYKTRSTHYLTNGSTSGIIAAVLAVKPEKIILWRNAHRCHLNAAELSGAEPVFYDLPMIEDWGIAAKTDPSTIEKLLETSHAKTVIITSPTYEGVVSDIPTIAEVCKKYGAYLIVDEAHGALYPFCDDLPQSAIEYADFTIQSLHKTAGGLNPTALLHCNCDLDVKSALDKITTTSPSYPLLTTIEANINFLNSQKGCNKIKELVQNIKSLKIPQDVFQGDITKILVKIPPNSLEKIEDEKTNDKSTLFLCGIGTDLKKLKRLESALQRLNTLK